jgi:biotin transport system ATP-binding protein
LSDGTLAVEGLGHQFADGPWGLRGVSVAFAPGEFAVIAGSNGAGKSLLMRHLVGLVAPTEGRVTLDGRDIREHLAEVRPRVGLVFQDPGAQIVGLTIDEEVRFGPRNLGWPRERVEAAAHTALAAVGLEGRGSEICAHLSGGESRRLAIAGVLACEPDALILDEPFTGLDLPAVKAVLTALTALHRAGKTIVLLTHELDKCLAHATRLVLMKRGEVLADGTPAQLWDRIPDADTHRPVGNADRIREMTWLG